MLIDSVREYLAALDERRKLGPKDLLQMPKHLQERRVQIINRLHQAEYQLRLEFAAEDAKTVKRLQKN